MKRALRCALAAAAAMLPALAAPLPASAQLFGSHGLEAKWCDLKTVRQTVIYVDDMIMYTGRTDWVRKLDAKLKASLTPGEHVTVVRLSPKTGQSQEAWSGCWPALTPETAEAHGLASYFTASPASEVADQQKYFFGAMGGALTQIYNAAVVPPADLSASEPPTKQILRAIASDDGRFTNSPTVIRAIIYSDMAESSDLGSAYKANKDPVTNYGAKLGSYLNRSVFYAFGVGSDIAGDPQFNENARAFWQVALHTMGAGVAGMGADLNVPNILPTRAATLPVDLDFEGQTFTGQLTLLTDPSGTLVDSILNVQRLGAASLSGTYVCRGAGCVLSAQTSSGVTTDAPSETVAMQGPEGQLSGTLGVAGNSRFVYPIKAGGRS